MRTCDDNRNHCKIHNYSVPGSYKLDNFINEYYILQCAGCDTVTFAKFTKYLNEKLVYTIEDIKIYPEPSKVTPGITMKLIIKYSNLIPQNIINLYAQLVSSYNRELNLLCAIGLRTLIEAICNELNIIKGYKYDSEGKALTQEGKKESIEGQIFGLFEKSHILWYETLILQRIREIGNAATHELVTPFTKELQSAIEIIERLLENIYHLKYHRLLNRDK